MASANSNLRISELDFFSIKENLKTYLRSQEEFTDFDFEGSGINVLLDILAYNTHYMGFYLNMVGNEMFLDTAQLRNSILSLAKLTNYVPASSKGAQALLNIRVTPSSSEDQSTTSVTLEKYTRLLGRDIDGINYPFVTINANTATKNADSFLFSNVDIRQGEVNTLQFEMTEGNTSRRFTIPSANVDTTTLVVSVQQSAANTSTDEYILAEDITELTGNSKVFFVEENENLTYTFYFGDNVLGQKPDAGNIVIATFLETSGPAANSISDFVFTDSIGSLYRNNVEISTVTSSAGGVAKEGIEQVRFRAPYHYTAQNRAVTKLDYETLLVRDFNNIEAVSVWGGEDNDPVVYGKVYISMKTVDNYSLTNLEKENIKEQLIRTRNVLTVTPEIVDPNFIYVVVKGRVTYNPSRTSLTAEEIKAYVRAAILDYKESELDTFQSVFRKSKLQTSIDNAQAAITGSDIDIYLQKRVDLETGENKNYNIKFDSRIKRGSLSERIYSYPQIVVRDSAAVDREVFFEEVPESLTGIDSIEITNAGRNYETAPTITITGDGVGANAKATIVAGRINSIDITSRGSNYTYATISISGGNGSEASAIARLQSRYGTLRNYYFKTNGEKVSINDNAATVDYVTGKIYVSGLLPVSVGTNAIYDEDVLTINVPSEDDIIYPLRNRIITIDEDDPSAIQIEVVAE